MGGKLSKQEELFVLGCWPELLEIAISTDAEIESGSADTNKNASNAFRMSFLEWQALISLLENANPSEVPSRLCAGINEAYLLNPIVVIMVHACCWLEGGVSTDAFSQRITRLQGATAEPHQSTPRQGRQNSEEEEREVVNMALIILSEFAVQRGGKAKTSSSSSGRRGARPGSGTVDNFISWDASKRPVVVLAHTFIVAVIACLHPEPRYAETAIQAFRKLQEAMDGAASSASRESLRVKSTACKVADWAIVQRLEALLVKRQQEEDVDDLLKTKDRWWFSSKANAMTQSALSLSTMSPEERWDAVPSYFIGQHHVWEALKTHFLSSDVFNAEKPTVIILFGPSGFGKSELARRLACVIHGVEPGELEASGKLVYIHLPSFCTRDSIYSLVDPPAAHVGEGILLSALRRNDDAVVVLDEFEKGAADAIQNLWLSAFQKKGTLRSLKDASRSISTEKVTFVLTCNIGADAVLRDEGKYLRATPEKQATMREGWIELCKEVCRSSMHDPFVNRVDYFFPFVPYSEEEKEQFIHLQLRRILLDQREKNRQIYVTPRMVKALGRKLRTFHASTIEGVMRPLLVEAVQKKWLTVVLSVEERTSGTVFVALPVTDNADEVRTWNSIPGAMKALEACENLQDNATEKSKTATAKKSTQSIPSSKYVSSSSSVANTSRKNSVVSYSSMETTTQPISQICSVIPSIHTEMDKECVMHLETTMERELKHELERVKHLLLQKDKEIMHLKEKILTLEKILALFLVTTLLCLFLLSFLIGMKTVLIMGLFLLVAIWLLVKMPLQLLMGALRALYGILGPVGSSIAVVVAAFWASKTVRNAAVC